MDVTYEGEVISIEEIIAAEKRAFKTIDQTKKKRPKLIKKLPAKR